MKTTISKILAGVQSELAKYPTKLCARHFAGFQIQGSTKQTVDGFVSWDVDWSPHFQIIDAAASKKAEKWIENNSFTQYEIGLLFWFYWNEYGDLVELSHSEKPIAHFQNYSYPIQIENNTVNEQISD